MILSKNGRTVISYGKESKYRVPHDDRKVMPVYLAAQNKELQQNEMFCAAPFLISERRQQN